MFYLFNCQLFVEIESKEGRKTAQFIILPEISKIKYRNRIPERNIFIGIKCVSEGLESWFVPQALLISIVNLCTNIGLLPFLM
jgi:hypothetical protein